LFAAAEVDRLLGGHHRTSNEVAPAKPGPTSVFWRVVRCEIEQFMSPQLLRDADVFTMCHGLELRTPFVDHQFLAATRAAGAWHLEGAPSYKIALFRHLADLFPPGHLSQSKAGFTLPFDQWLRKALTGAPTRFGRELRTRLNRSEYAPFVTRFLRGRLHWSRIWALYVLERTRASSSTRWTSQSSSSTTTPRRFWRAV
jgi:asparagine synthetase B (glutamine-hydrolysing)